MINNKKIISTTSDEIVLNKIFEDDESHIDKTPNENSPRDIIEEHFLYE